MNLMLVLSPKAKWLVLVFFFKINLVIITGGLCSDFEYLVNFLCGFIFSWFLCIVFVDFILLFLWLISCESVCKPVFPVGAITNY